MYKVVIVDDEPIQCKGLKNILNKMYDSLEVQTFVEAEPALKYIEEESVQIVITDICMPEMDGLYFTEKIKEINEKIKVILLTGYPEGNCAWSIRISFKANESNQIAEGAGTGISGNCKRAECDPSAGGY